MLNITHSTSWKLQHLRQLQNDNVVAPHFIQDIY